MTLFPGAAMCTDVISWGDNTVEWNHRIGVTEIRMGCDLSPSACMQRVAEVARAQQVGHVSVAISGEPDAIATSMLEYSTLSVREPALASVGIDDFLSMYWRWVVAHPIDAPQQLLLAARNLKSGNPALRFGITLYEDDLDSPFLGTMPQQVRAAVDRVSLFLHYRGSGPGLAEFVDVVKRLFPNASIIAGVYAYDRIDYLPCARHEKTSCTYEEESALFEATLANQLRLVKSGVLAGIELYPGQFGREDDWAAWKNERICRPVRRTGCIAQTKRLREVMRRVMGGK
jgi:hypothetical protein